MPANMKSRIVAPGMMHAFHILLFGINSSRIYAIALFIPLGSFSNRGGPLNKGKGTIAPSAILRGDKEDHISKNKLKVAELSDAMSARGSVRWDRDDSSVFSFASRSSAVSGATGGSAGSSSSRSTAGHRTKRQALTEHYVESVMAVQRHQKQRVEVRSCVNRSVSVICAHARVRCLSTCCGLCRTSCYCIWARRCCEQRRRCLLRRSATAWLPWSD